VQNIYLSNYELDEAINLYFNKLGFLEFEKETINTWDSNGRVTTKQYFL